MPKINEVVCSNCSFIQHPPKEKVESISCENLKKKIDNKENIILLDVRERWEHGMSNINNSTLMPLRELKNGINKLDKSKQVVVLCHLGERSEYAARFLIQNGFNNVKNLEGGINAWAARIDKTLKLY